MRCASLHRVYSTVTAIFVALVCGITVSSADTVYFNDADRGPSSTLQIGGITVSPWVFGDNGLGQPATVLGVGLGIDGGIGLIHEVNGGMHYAAGQEQADWGSYETGIHLAGDDTIDTINSVTLMPVFRIFSGLGTLLPDQLNFEMFFVYQPGGNYRGLSPPYTNPITFELLNSPHKDVFINITADFGQSIHFNEYRMAHLQDELTLEYGVTILSLDFTPVAEPSVVSLLVMALFGLVSLIRKARPYG